MVRKKKTITSFVDMEQLTIHHFGVVVDTSSLNSGLFIFQVLVPELCVVANTIG